MTDREREIIDAILASHPNARHNPDRKCMYNMEIRDINTFKMPKLVEFNVDISYDDSILLYYEKDDDTDFILVNIRLQDMIKLLKDKLDEIDDNNSERAQLIEQLIQRASKTLEKLKALDCNWVIDSHEEYERKVVKVKKYFYREKSMKAEIEDYLVRGFTKKAH